ncbi:hypothetical protein RJ639_018726 [Escallonia herrerae]|uniref:BED-type domain-containing protein n=1 Tax=Escallonia herrerae TaxID=1293975 RepID=A0AA88VA18_9ASTE|nr:hypothetical protein RJ639_018726 [Escallonia herrerae]
MEISEETVMVDSSRLKSVVWRDFDRVKKGDKCVAVCRHCKKRLSGSSTSGTSHLRNHLIRCRRRSNNDISQLPATRGKRKEGNLALANYDFEQELRKIEKTSLMKTEFEEGQTKDGTAVVGISTFDHKRSRFNLARMIILHGYPLSMVEHVGFRTFVRNLQPLFELVSFAEVEADCKHIYHNEKQKVAELLEKLPGKVSLTVDMWVGKAEAKYLCLTAHYIDDTWLLNKKILNFIMVDPSHTEDMLSEFIMTSLMDWGMDRKLFAMTFDDSTYDNVACRIRERLSQNRFLLCKGQLFEVRCAANVIKLMVQDILEALDEVIHKLIEWCQSSDEYVSCLALKMKSKFDEYWKKCSLALAIAAILDPRFKMKLVEYYFPQIYGSSAPDYITVVSKCMKELYNGHDTYSPLASDGLVGGSGGESAGINIVPFSLCVFKLHGMDRDFYSVIRADFATNIDPFMNGMNSTIPCSLLANSNSSVQYSSTFAKIHTPSLVDGRSDAMRSLLQ